MSEQYTELFAELQGQNTNVQKGCLFSPTGDVLFSAGDWDVSGDAKTLLDAWLNHGPRLEVQGTGYSILRSEPEQLVSKNIAGKGSVVGSITKGGNYLIAHLGPCSSEQVGRDYLDVARAAAKMK